MAKNAEELYEQEQFERRNYARLTDDQKKIKLISRQLKNAQDSVAYYEQVVPELEEELKLARNTNDYLNDELDKLVNQRDQINGACNKVVTDSQFSDALFKDEVLDIMRWKR